MQSRRHIVGLRAGICLALAGLFTGLTAAAQDRQAPTSFINRQRSIEEGARKALDRELPITDKFNLEVGGWLDNYILLFDDGVNSSRTLRQYDFRVYGGLTLDRGVHEFYARMRANYLDWNHGDSYTRNEDDLSGPNLERGWYKFDVRKAAKEYGKNDLPFDLQAKIGRDFVQMGTGYAIALPLDQVSLVGEWRRFQTTFVLGRTPDSSPNIDRSRPVADHSARTFWMVEERYKGFQNHEPFVYWALQADHTSEDPTDLLQNYRYNSQYVGFGSTGQLVRNLRYSTEWVIERGTSYGDKRFMHTDQIKSWAFDQLLEYYFQHRTKPKLSFEYMFAGGDPDRLGSPTDAIGGNRKNHVDNSFVGFGYRDTGLDFAPRLSNMHVWRAGASFRPLPDVKPLKNLEVGTDWFLYAKARSAGAVSDPTATDPSGYAGWEMDYYTNYRITSDLSFTVRFGSFFPGQAFEDRTTRTFLLSGVTWSF